MKNRSTDNKMLLLLILTELFPQPCIQSEARPDKNVGPSGFAV
jgi:hypothetical protein